GLEPGLFAGLLQKSFAIPTVSRCDLRQQQATRISFADQQAMFADFDFANVLHSLHRREYGDFKLDGGKFRFCQRHESGIAYSGGNRAFRRASIQRTRGMNITNTTTQLLALMNGYEDSMRFVERPRRNVGQTRRLAREIGLDGVPCDLKEKLLVVFS